MPFRKLNAERKRAVAIYSLSALRRYRGALYLEVAVYEKSNGICPCIAAVDMLTGIYIKLARAVCFALYGQRPCGIDTVNINFIFIITVFRCSCTTADDMVFRAVRQNNGRAVGQLHRSRRRGSHGNAFERKSFGAVVPC